MLPWCSDFNNPIINPDARNGPPGVHAVNCRSSLPVCDGLNGVEGTDCRKSEMEV